MQRKVPQIQMLFLDSNKIKWSTMGKFGLKLEHHAEAHKQASKTERDSLGPRRMISQECVIGTKK